MLIDQAIYPLYLNGEWVAFDRTLSVTNPATGQQIAEVGVVDRRVVRQAIEDAQVAYPRWRSLTAMDRADYLLKVADALLQRCEEIAKTITLENGKPLSQSVGEVNMAVDHFRWYAEEGRRSYGQIIPHQVEGKRHLVARTPVGVVGAIAPWNFPLVLSARKVAPALAAGCPVILKPASATPLCTIALAECIAEQDLPAGVFQLALGDAKEIASEMLSHPDCRKVSFTGSTAVGKELVRGAAGTMTKLSLELGGHAPFFVFEDANLEEALEGALIAKFRNNGQSCIAANRIYVQQSVYEPFLEKFVAAVQRLKIGDGMEEGVDVSTMINIESREKALQHISDAVERGARIMCGGRVWGNVGAFLEPTVLADVPSAAACMSEETFGPVAPVCTFESDDEAIQMANNTQYGLAAYIYSNNLNRIIHFCERVEFGTVCVNDSVPSVSSCPIGGFKESGWGRELGMAGLEAFLETKHISIGNVL